VLGGLDIVHAVDSVLRVEDLGGRAWPDDRAAREAGQAGPAWPGVDRRLPRPDAGRAGWPIVTLGEGGTPLLPAPRLSERTGCEVFLKVDGMNPTGSFKDRGMTMAVTDALAHGKQGVICASTGNTSASARPTRRGPG
jgi:threonine synthase